MGPSQPLSPDDDRALRALVVQSALRLDEADLTLEQLGRLARGGWISDDRGSISLTGKALTYLLVPAPRAGWRALTLGAIASFVGCVGCGGAPFSALGAAQGDAGEPLDAIAAGDVVPPQGPDSSSLPPDAGATGPDAGDVVDAIAPVDAPPDEPDAGDVVDAIAVGDDAACPPGLVLHSDGLGQSFCDGETSYTKTLADDACRAFVAFNAGAGYTCGLSAACPSAVVASAPALGCAAWDWQGLAQGHVRRSYGPHACGCPNASDLPWQ
jgi:hypothetical protein